VHFGLLKCNRSEPKLKCDRVSTNVFGVEDEMKHFIPSKDRMGLSKQAFLSWEEWESMHDQARMSCRLQSRADYDIVELMIRALSCRKLMKLELP
jgi:hypothetical protein